MKAIRSLAVMAALAAALLAACKQEPPAPESTDAPVAPPSAQTPAPGVEPSPPVSFGQATFLGFGEMRLGSTIEEAKSAWGGELKGAPSEGSGCHYLFPVWVKQPSDLAFMMEDGKFVRYDVGNTAEAAPGGGKVGMSTGELKKIYGDALQASPHKYVDGGQYLSVDASGVAPSRLVFETDANGDVTRWRVGLSPQADYVEGCS